MDADSIAAGCAAGAPRSADLAAVRCEAFAIPSSDGASRVWGDVWLPPEGRSPVAVVQLVHGMAEHIRRYDLFARELALLGCAVAGHDHLGHGRSVSSPDAWGVLAPGQGAEHLVADVQRVRTLLDQRFPSVPHVMFGHSMGSFVLRAFLGRHGHGLAAAVVCGTGWQPRAALALGRAVTRAIGALRGWDRRSKFVDALAAGAYARRFAGEEGGDLAWLTRDAAARQAYADDAACGFMFSVAAYHELFRLVGMAQDRTLVAQMPDELPVLLISGDKDPVGGMGTAPGKVAALMRSCGSADVQLKLYPDARHELLNEVNRDEVVADVVAWLQAKGVLDGA